MVPTGSKKNTEKNQLFFHMLEKEAGHYPVDLFKIGENGSLQGVLALDSSLPPKKKKELFQAVGSVSVHQTADHTQTDRTGLPGRDSLQRHAALELDRVKKCRLPCSMLLIKIKGDKQAQPLSSTAVLLENQIPGNAYLAQHDDSTLSLLLPGYNLKKSLRQAAAIQKSLSPQQTTIGLAVCMFRNIPGAETFINMAEEELRRAETDKKDICHSESNTEDNSCQVTAEERSQLFSFLNSAKS